MPTNAIPSIGTSVRLGNNIPLAPLSIVGATNATPIVITTSNPHGVTDVSHGTVVGVLGNTGANGIWVVSRVDNTHLTLRGSAGNGIYSSGGTLTIDSTYSIIAELREIASAGISVQMENVGALDGNGWGSMLPVERTGKPMRLDMHLVPNHATHDHLTGLLYLTLSGVVRPYMLVLSDSAHHAAWFQARVVDHETTIVQPGVLRAQATFAIDGVFVYTP